jgi:hypothetical protein
MTVTAAAMTAVAPAVATATVTATVATATTAARERVISRGEQETRDDCNGESGDAMSTSLHRLSGINEAAAEVDFPRAAEASMKVEPSALMKEARSAQST